MLLKGFLSFFPIILMLFSVCFGQNKQTVDSLESLASLQTDSLQSATYNQLASMHLYSSAGKAFQYAEKALAAAEKTNATQSLAEAHRQLGLANWQLGNFPEASEQFYIALPLFEKINDKQGIANTIGNLGLVQNASGNYEEAIKFYQEAVVKQLEINNKGRTAVNYNNLGDTYFAQKEYAKAIEYYHKALNTYDKKPKDVDKVTNFRNLGAVYTVIGNYDSAYYYLTSNDAIYASLNEQRGRASNYALLAALYLKQGKTIEAQNAALQGLDIAQKLRLKPILRDIYELLTSIYVQQKNYISAFDAQGRMIIYRDSVTNEKNINKIMGQRLAYEKQKKDLEINLLKKINEQSIQNQKIITIAAISIVLLISVFALYVYKGRKQAREKNILLEAKNAEINEQKEELAKQKEELAAQTEELKISSQNLSEAFDKIQAQKNKLEEQTERLKDLNRQKDKIFSVISHDLRSPMASLKGALSILHPDILSKEELITIKDSLTVQFNGVDTILKNLLQWVRSQKEGQTIVPTSFDVEEIISSNIYLLTPLAEDKHITFDVLLPPDLKVYADLNQMSAVVRNLLSNAIKFTPKNGKISVRGSKTSDSEALITVADTGVGMTAEQVQKLFNAETHFTTRGTLGEKGSGIGLMLCKEFVEQNGGKIFVESETSKGTKFSFSVPLANV
jgi:signal transduction histidine kinase